jgi:hypothetical protein
LTFLDTVDVRLCRSRRGWGEDILNRRLDHFKNAAPDRFMVLVVWAVKWGTRRINLADGRHPGCASRARGAQGLKIWKPFGLQRAISMARSFRRFRLGPSGRQQELNLPVLIPSATR